MSCFRARGLSFRLARTLTTTATTTDQLPPKPPLHNVRVLDLSRILAGPFAAQLLGDLGADVIKVEKPGKGDDTRQWGPPFKGGESAYFFSANRNKRSVAIDMSKAEGLDLVRCLADQSDIVIENFKVGGADKLGLGYAELSKRNPKLIYVSISGYGSTGPLAQQPGYDFMAQAMGGLMHITGKPDGEPMKVGVAITDVCTGILTQGACLAALISRSQTGLGQKIEASLFESQLAMLVNIASNFLVSEVDCPRYGNAHPSIVPYEMFHSSDEPIVIGAGNNEQFVRLCQVIGLPELSKDSKFITNAERVRNRKELIVIIQTAIEAKEASHWLPRLEKAGIPCARVNSIPEAFNHPQVKARNMITTLQHPVGEVKVVSHPIKYGRTPAVMNRPPPMLGEHTHEVLEQLLGIGENERQELIKKGIIQCKN